MWETFPSKTDMPIEMSLSYRPLPAPQSTAATCSKDALAIGHHTSSLAWPSVSQQLEEAPVADLRQLSGCCTY